MSTETELIRIILGDKCPTDAEAVDVLEAALLAEVDPLDYCSLTLRIGPELALQRAAAWAGVAFFDVVPHALPSALETIRLDMLADIRLFRIPVLDRTVLFCAPQFFELIQIRARVNANPALRSRICAVPTNSLREHLVRNNAGDLLDDARQRLVRKWPFATAHLELTLAARLVFVITLLIVLLLVAVSPFLDGPILLPVVVLVLALPAAIRLAAVLHLRHSDGDTVPARPEDAELPIYSVLIPLCDEAHMVQALAQTLLALDYPALCIKRTKRRR